MAVPDYIKAHLALALVQLNNGGYHVITKVALSDGINQLVFCVFRDLIALAILAPCAFFKERRTCLPMTRRVLFSCVFLGFTGIFANQLLFLLGLSFTSPSYAAAFQPGIPVLTFFLTLCMGTERIDFRQWSGMAKVGGIVVCVLGAILMTIYKGPVIWGNGLVDMPMRDANLGELTPDPGSWVSQGLLGLKIDMWHVGVVCLIGNCFCMSLYIAFQAPLLDLYPASLSVTAYSYFFGVVFMVLLGLFGASDLREWALDRSELLAVIYAGIVASALNYGLLTWSNKILGPALVAVYMPLQPLCSSILAGLFLKSSLFLGSVLGGLMMIAGLYCVTWGQMRVKRVAAVGEHRGPELEDIDANESMTEPLLKVLN